MRLWLVIPILFVACSKPEAPKSRPPPLVGVTQVSTEDVWETVRAPVDVRPLAQADVGAKVVGYLDSVLVDRGDVVKRGQLLALVRPSDLPDQLGAAKSAYQQAQAGVALAKANLDRAQKLAPQGVVSQQDLQQATTSAATAAGAEAAAQSQMEVIAVRLGETRLVAPFDGVITNRRLDPGALVGLAASPPVVTVARIDRVRVFVGATEREAPALKLGQDATLSLDAFPGRTFSGKVERLSPAFDPVTRTLDAEVQLDNSNGELRPGMYGRASVRTAVHTGALVVPVSSVVVSDGRAWVYVLQQGDVRTVARRIVKVGVDLGDRLEIVDGLKAGEVVVAEGVDSVFDGAPVRATLPKPVQAADAAAEK